jgi:DNA repair protein RecN (Recombination protein N)
MLTELRIRNLAVIESVTLPIAPGFNVLSGETGAGKSIIVGALGLLLGERGSAEIVRSGADRATVEGIFDAGGQPEVQAALDERGIAPEDGVLLLRREVSAAGKSRAWINDTSVTTGALASLGRLLVNLHGQHESQALLREDAQREALDALAGATDVASAVRTAHAELDEARAAIAELERRRDRASRSGGVRQRSISKTRHVPSSGPNRQQRRTRALERPSIEKKSALLQNLSISAGVAEAPPATVAQ